MNPNTAKKKQEAIAKKLIKQLDAAAESMFDYYDICLLLGEPARIEGDDARLLLKERMEQYANILKRRFRD